MVRVEFLREEYAHNSRFQTLIMFLGESLCIIYYFVMKWRERRSSQLLINVSSPIGSPGESIDVDLEEGEKKVRGLPNPLFSLPHIACIAQPADLLYSCYA